VSSSGIASASLPRTVNKRENSRGKPRPPSVGLASPSQEAERERADARLHEEHAAMHEQGLADDELRRTGVSDRGDALVRGGARPRSHRN
jgi:hypothetical protein